MDLKALIAKMDSIESMQMQLESDARKAAKKSEREVELPSGAKVKATKVQGWQSQKADKESDTDRKKNDKNMEESFNSAIAKAIVEEFGYELEEENLEEAPVANPYQGADAAKFAAMSPEDQAWLTKGGGKPDINDEFILARAPNKGKPAVQKVDPNQADRDDAEMGAAMAANAAQATPTAAAPAAAPAADPAKVARFKALLDKLQAQGGAGAAPKAESVDGDDQILAMIRNI
jgi:hypothetical protein